ncbi:cytochrome c [Roseibaca sp. V10]|uniref:Cytochrome c n=1 Tax=Roseinatronobacter domitianus TaxID=2940293 RepID=A0ABT0LX68_9RHOB|nr:cytochrome c [Roseibaca domitiana]MCL1627209.1 cytochrome c [Roseibaca domitiana]
MKLKLGILGLAILVGAGFWAMSGQQAQSVMVDVTVPELSAPEQKGAALFAQNCATCHGENAAGKDGVGPPLVHIIYEPSHHGDGSFYVAARMGVRAHHWSFGNMPAQPQITDEDVAKIVAYIRALQRANGIF